MAQLETAPTRDEIVATALTIPGWYQKDRLDFLYALAWQARREAKAVFLEVGTWYGRSAYVLGAVANKLFCVDTWVGLPQDPTDKRYADVGVFEKAQEYLAPWPVMFVPGNSKDILPPMADESFGLVHLDGDHTSPQVDQDVREGWRLTVPNGFLCGDDFDEYDVERAVRALGQPYEVYLGKLWWIRKSKDGP